MKAASFACALLLPVVTMAVEPLELNVVDESKTCRLDEDCNYKDLDYITGNGKPMSNGDVCCATFPRELWNPTTQDYEFTKSKLCYSKRILSNSSDFNYYRAAYCDGAMAGIYAISMSLAIGIVVFMSF